MTCSSIFTDQGNLLLIIWMVALIIYGPLGRTQNHEKCIEKYNCEEWQMNTAAYLCIFLKLHKRDDFLKTAYSHESQERLSGENGHQILALERVDEQVVIN